MLPLDPFGFEAPDSLDEALVLLREPGARPIAGGTDLVPSMKHRLFAPNLLVSTRRLPELRGIGAVEDGGLAIGAATTLRDVGRNPTIRERYPALAAACATIATPTIQAMGTLGGNVMLDTRCVFYNQPAGWRAALGGCLKKDGTICHVAPRGTGCYAAHSADTVPALWLYGAQIEVASGHGVRRIGLADIYADDGRTPPLRTDELLTRIVLPAPSDAVVHRKARARGAIDYALVLVAVARGSAAYRAVISAIGPRPIAVEANTPAELAEAATKACQPLPTHLQPSPWRKKLLRVEVARAAALLSSPR
jgi:4-hydroxybenzoyl-CoA reductase subunit beta